MKTRISPERRVLSSMEPLVFLLDSGRGLERSGLSQRPPVKNKRRRAPTDITEAFIDDDNHFDPMTSKPSISFT
jgi:hypothetical protein